MVKVSWRSTVAASGNTAGGAVSELGKRGLPIHLQATVRDHGDAGIRHRLLKLLMPDATLEPDTLGPRLLCQDVLEVTHQVLGLPKHVYDVNLPGNVLDLPGLRGSNTGQS